MYPELRGLGGGIHLSKSLYGRLGRAEGIRDEDGYEGYVRKVLPTILQSSGRPIVVEDPVEVLEMPAD